MMEEKKRASALLDEHYSHTFDYLAGLSPEQLAKTFEPSAFMFMGTRINNLNLGSVVRHLMVAEGHWISRLAECQDDDDIRFPDAPAQYDNLSSVEELKKAYAGLHAHNLDLIAHLSENDLTKSVSFTGRRYSGVGFLWTIVSHHGFHMGQIDLMLRLLGMEPVEYMEWETTNAEVV